jgi:hypothetical protein
MLAAHFDEGFVGALNDALRADIDPRAGGHLAVHHEALAVELVEMVPGCPVRHEIRVGDQHARRVGVGSEHADRLAGLHEQRLVRIQPLQGRDDLVEALPVTRGAPDAAIDDELARPLGDVGIEIVHQHAQGIGEPAFRTDLRAMRRADDAHVVEAGLDGHGILTLILRAARSQAQAPSQAAIASKTLRSVARVLAARAGSSGVGRFVSSTRSGSII